MDSRYRFSVYIETFQASALWFFHSVSFILPLPVDHHERRFIETAVRLPAVVCCRCSPTQKAVIVTLIKKYTGKRVCAIGDGGNDVSMIQAADVGVGIVGKEGKQASLAADFSVTQFRHITRLMMWHGRNNYKRSAKLSQFIIHRGLIISVIQAVFSAIFFFAPIALYQVGEMFRFFSCRNSLTRAYAHARRAPCSSATPPFTRWHQCFPLCSTRMFRRRLRCSTQNCTRTY